MRAIRSAGTFGSAYSTNSFSTGRCSIPSTFVWLKPSRLCLRRYSPSWATTNAGRAVVDRPVEPAGRIGNISLPFPPACRQAMDELLEPAGPRSLADQLLAQLPSRCLEDGDCDRRADASSPLSGFA